MPNHAFLGFFFLGGVEPLNIVGRHPNPQTAHPWVTGMKNYNFRPLPCFISQTIQDMAVFIMEDE